MNNTRNQTIDEVRADAARFWNDAVRAENEMMALRDRVARLVEALEFYADPDAWAWQMDEDGGHCEVVDDNGKQARAALDEWRKA